MKARSGVVRASARSGLVCVSLAATARVYRNPYGLSATGPSLATVTRNANSKPT